MGDSRVVDTAGIRHLERAEPFFVHRTRAQDDRREVLLALTPKGEKVLAELALHHHDELRSSGPELVTALRRVMRAFLSPS